MGYFKNIFLSLINLISQILPKDIQRRIADFPGVLSLFEKLSRGRFEEIYTPEGHVLVLNPLFHSNLVTSGKLCNYEPGIKKLILKYTKPNMIAYDIGANIGIFSFLISSIVGKNGIVYAFEPEKNNYICFEKALEINNAKNLIMLKI